MDCMFCKDAVKQFDGPRKAHLVAFKGKDGHIHVHGEIDNKDDMRDILDATSEELHIDLRKQVMDRKEIVFHNRQRIGDALVFTCAVRDFKKAFPGVRVNVESIAGHIWDYNPYIDRTLRATKENTLNVGPGKLTNASNRIDWHFTNAYRVSMEEGLKIHIPQGESRPDIWFTQEEYAAPRLFDFPYWIICLTGEKGWGCKMYPFDKWQAFVDQNPDVYFVQIGAKEDDPPRLQGAHVIDFVGKTQDKNTGIRDLFKLFLNAEGSIGLVSFHMHLSGALYKPCIVVAGAREPVAFTRYPGHQYLATDGTLPCAVAACWHCDIKMCTNIVEYPNRRIDNKVPKCVDMIEPEDLTRSLGYYYRGGRLDKNIPAARPKQFKNIVKTPPRPFYVPPSPREEDCPSILIDTHGYDFKAGSITKRDFVFLKNVIEAYNVKRVLEFGAGVSTILLNDLGVAVTTYETDFSYIDRIKKINPNLDIRHWDGQTIPDDRRFDLVFVDGPSGGNTREPSTRIAVEKASIVVVHDGTRSWETQWQEKYLVGKYQGPGKGGSWCHLWVKNGYDMKLVKQIEISSVETQKTGIKKEDGHDNSKDKERVSGQEQERKESVQAEPKLGSSPQTVGAGGILQKKHVKIVSTARGWGGCARSITTIMRLLLAQGCLVEFIPFRNKVSSNEFQKALAGDLKDVVVSEHYHSVHEKCDVFFMYADDYVWEFAKPEMAEIFGDINADRKVMMLNYRNGSVGQTPWTRDWDKYMFLNSGQERELLKLHPGVKTKVLPPCTDLAPFFNVQPHYNGNLRVVRHSSQGDTKFDRGHKEEVQAVMDSNLQAQFYMLPGPSFIPDSERFIKYKRTAEPQGIAEFLQLGNVFWYSLPKGYLDMGPRVILEAMAAGLPVIADNWGGAVDRVTPETGWLCNTKEEQVELLKNISFEEIERKGKAARERAKAEFVPQRWIEAILT